MANLGQAFSRGIGAGAAKGPGLFLDLEAEKRTEAKRAEIEKKKELKKAQERNIKMAKELNDAITFKLEGRDFNDPEVTKTRKEAILAVFSGLSGGKKATPQLMHYVNFITQARGEAAHKLGAVIQERAQGGEVNLERIVNLAYSNPKLFTAEFSELSKSGKARATREADKSRIDAARFPGPPPGMPKAPPGRVPTKSLSIEEIVSSAAKEALKEGDISSAANLQKIQGRYATQRRAEADQDRAEKAAFRAKVEAGRAGKRHQFAIKKAEFAASKEAREKSAELRRINDEARKVREDERKAVQAVRDVKAEDRKAAEENRKKAQEASRLIKEKLDRVKHDLSEAEAKASRLRLAAEEERKKEAHELAQAKSRETWVDMQGDGPPVSNVLPGSTLATELAANSYGPSKGGKIKGFFLTRKEEQAKAEALENVAISGTESMLLFGRANAIDPATGKFYTRAGLRRQGWTLPIDKIDTKKLFQQKRSVINMANMAVKLIKKITPQSIGAPGATARGLNSIANQIIGFAKLLPDEFKPMTKEQGEMIQGVMKGFLKEAAMDSADIKSAYTRLVFSIAAAEGFTGKGLSNFKIIEIKDSLKDSGSPAQFKSVVTYTVKTLFESFANDFKLQTGVVINNPWDEEDESGSQDEDSATL